MTDILVQRGLPSNDANFGVMFLNGFFQCFTLEHTPKLFPVGDYPAIIYFSPKMQRNVVLLQDVPDRTSIEIHVANFPYQLEGCIAVGNTLELNGIGNSMAAFQNLMSKILDNNIRVRVRDY